MGLFKRQEEPTIGGEIGKLDLAAEEKRKQEEAGANLRRLMEGYNQLPPEFQRRMLNLVRSPENTHAE
jgi:hypothetical protein